MNGFLLSSRSCNFDQATTEGTYAPARKNSLEHRLDALNAIPQCSKQRFWRLENGFFADSRSILQVIQLDFLYHGIIDVTDVPCKFDMKFYHGISIGFYLNYRWESRCSSNGPGPAETLDGTLPQLQSLHFGIEHLRRDINSSSWSMKFMEFTHQN